MSTSAPERSKGVSDVFKVGFYHIIKTIGQGHSAVVKLANHTITKSDVAIKIIDKRQKDANMEKIYREIKILKMLKHPNVIKLYQVMDSENLLYIVSEYAPNGEIFDYISNHGKFPEKEAKIKFSQILEAVEYCHNLGIVHRDLKAENLLLDENFNVKLADFGFGNFYNKGDLLSTWCGSPPYAAPEIFEGKTYCGPEVDVWSLGVILYVLVCGMLPFDGENLRAIRDKVVTGRFRIPYFMSMDCESLLKRILTVDPKRRYTIPQIKAHCWIKEHVQASHKKNLEQDFMDNLVVTGRGISAICHDIVIQRMENAKINKDRVIESLEKESYDNFTAIYKILKEKVVQRVRQNLPCKLGAAGMRRPSVISEQAMIHPQLQRQQGIPTQQIAASPTSPGEAKPPGLAETREAPFSQTTDGVQLQEVAGAFCQMQQIISTSDSTAEDMDKLAGAIGPAGPSGGGVLIMPSSPLRPKLTRSHRLILSPHNCWSKMPCSKGGMSSQLAENSIDEGVEIEGEEMLGAHAVSSTLQASSVVTTSQPPCQPSISIDSNIELDMAGSNLSLSSPASWSVNSTSSNLVEVVSRCRATHCEESDEIAEDSQGRIPEDLTNFQMGRRASDGLAIRPDMSESYAHYHLFPKNRACGMAELRKELVKLQNETMDGQGVQLQTIAGHKSRALLQDQKSLEETHVAKGTMGIKYCTNLLPRDVCWMMQKRNPPYSRHAHLPSPIESHQGGLRTDYTCLGTAHRPISPLRGCPKRQVGPMRSVPLHHHIHQNYAMVSGHQFFAEHLASASNSPTRGGKMHSIMPITHVCLASSSSPGDVNQISSYAPITNISSLGIPQNFVPVCHSQGNLVQNVLFGSPTRHKLEASQQPTTSLVQSSSSSPHPCSTKTVCDSRVETRGSALPAPAEDVESVSPDDGEKCPHMKRMMFSLVQQQPVVGSGSEEEMIVSPGDSPDDENIKND